MGKNPKEIPSKTLGLFKNIASYFAPPPLLTVSEWADKYRVLRSATSAEPGSWSTDRVPYMREIMDCLAETSPVQSVCFMKSAQISGPLWVETPIPTVDGWKNMGDLQPGDVVFDENGCRTMVTAVSPVFYNRDCYEITFSDGSVVLCDAEHLWSVDMHKHGKLLGQSTKKTTLS